MNLRGWLTSIMVLLFSAGLLFAEAVSAQGQGGGPYGRPGWGPGNPNCPSYSARSGAPQGGGQLQQRQRKRQRLQQSQTQTPSAPQSQTPSTQSGN